MCNCRGKSLQRQSKPPNERELSAVVFCLQVDSTNSRKYYLGTSEDEFKTRYNNHTMSFRNKGYEKETELSKYVWKFKEKGEDFAIKQSFAAKASPYICGSKRCDLCLTKKLLIAKAHPRTLLNKRSAIVSKCRHRNKFT